jgi:xanthine dehydrogenase accessory factor
MTELEACWRAGETVGVATVVGTWKSATPTGRVDAVGPDGTAVASVSGGCVEGAVYEVATGATGSERRRCSATA